MHKIFCCCSFAIGDPDPLSPVFRVAKSTGVEPFLFGARGSAPASTRTRGTAIAHGAVQRCDSALIKSVWVGAGPNEFGNDQGLLVRVPSGRARPTIDSIMRRLCTTPVPRASVRAPGDQLLYNAGLFRRRTHMQCGIALGDVVLDPIEKILFCCLSGCATGRALSCEVRRSIKQPDGRRNVTRDDYFHECTEGIDLFVNGLST